MSRLSGLEIDRLPAPSPASYYKFEIKAGALVDAYYAEMEERVS